MGDKVLFSAQAEIIPGADAAYRYRIPLLRSGGDNSQARDDRAIYGCSSPLRRR